MEGGIPVHVKASALGRFWGSHRWHAAELFVS
jgi:hypothetical protein